MEPIKDILKRLSPRAPNYNPDIEVKETLNQYLNVQELEYTRAKIFNDFYRLYANCSLQDFAEGQKVKNWLENGKGVYIYGNVGVGKTHLALSCLKWQFDRGEKGWIWSVSELLDRFRWFISLDDGVGLADDIKKWCSIPLLILDDLGVQKGTPWADEKLAEIISQRWLNRDKLITVITSNYSHIELAQKAKEEVTGERIVSRIMGMCEVLQLKGKDRRLGKKG